MNQDLCPCGSQQAYNTCCQPYLLGNANPATAEQLMRSRYTAFYTENVDYLIATHHPSKRKPDDREQLAQTIQQTDWLALRVLKMEDDPATPSRGSVEFVAFYQERRISLEPDFALDVPAVERDSPQQLHEKSEFIKEQGQWFYLQGVSLAPIKISRGSPCWCGSGKKLKQCHAKRR